MKRLLFLLIPVFLFCTTSAQTTKVVYTCPMHPEVQQSKPGSCPKCGMDLEKKTIRTKAKAAPKKTVTPPKPKPKPSQPIQKVTPDSIPITKSREQTETKDLYTCPMHPEVQSDKPGTCTKCGMALVKKKGSEPIINSDDKKPETKIVYTCVMHPEIQQDKPGSCPKCGMTLVRKTVPVSHESDTLNADIKKEEESAIDKMVGSSVSLTQGKTIIYHLFVKDTLVNFTGKSKKAIAINGSIPAPVLTFTEGDTAEIHLHNMLDEETSLHWHGIILPNQFDGVPLLTTRRIKPGDTYVYKFKIVQNGTY
ncbi:MAG: heavy metal-binding domain-containing protein, partial [Flavisolibacter sp.]